MSRPFHTFTRAKALRELLILVSKRAKRERPAEALRALLILLSKE
jgi:hypothetical protein